MAGSFKHKIGINEVSLKNNNIWKAVLAEFLGTFILNFFGCLSCTTGNLTAISLAFGLAVFMVVMTVGHVSGGHINPAVTVGMLAGGKIKIVRAIFYIIAQCAGSTAGSASVRALLPATIPDPGHTNLTHVNALQGLGIEFVLGFLLILTVYGVCDENKPESKFVAPLAIGLTVTLGHLGAVGFTGASMNPGRTFGTAIIYGIWENHWVYWVGPCLGAIGAALIYTQALKAPPTEIDISERYRTTADEKEMRRLDRKGDGMP